MKQGSHALCPLDMFAVLYSQDSSRLDFAAAFNVIMQKQLQGQRANVSLVINSGLTTLCDMIIVIMIVVIHDPITPHSLHCVKVQTSLIR